MKILKNIFFGFSVGFLGSIPVGYLNIIGIQIYKNKGILELIFYLFGVISIEVLVIYFTLIFAKKLSENIKLKKQIALFELCFYIVLAFLFYNCFDFSITSNHKTLNFAGYSTFFIGLILNSFNFMQIPFWTTWNLYLLSKNLIIIEKKLKYYYLIGTFFGVFFGMLFLVLILSNIILNFNTEATIIFKKILPLFLILISIVKGFKFQKKYF
jgi:hypothetical protein